MKYDSCDIYFQEIPGEISIGYAITGCKVACKGCHSTHLWNKSLGTELTPVDFSTRLIQYKNMITCVLFFGGEWYEHELIQLLKIAKSHKLKTALYTGLYSISQAIQDNLTYLKTGPWVEDLGGLDSSTTNQQLVRLDTNERLNHLFV